MKKCSVCGLEKKIDKGTKCSACKQIAARAKRHKKEDPPKESHGDAEVIIEDTGEITTLKTLFTEVDTGKQEWRSTGSMGKGYWVFPGKHLVGDIESSCLNPDCSHVLVAGERHAIKVPGQKELPLPKPIG